MEVVNIKKAKIESKKRQILGWFEAKIQNGKGFVIRNKEYLLTLTPVLIGGVTTVCKVVGKRMNLCKQKEVKDLYCYDRSLGHYWRLRRELSNKEWVDIDRRKRNGERLADILESMKVLK